LRDVTANVESIPLIASSIMSKKIAANSDVIILDVKVGNGAFMSEYKEALELAKTMLSIAKNFNKVSSAIITDMNEPLNRYIGNYIEVISAVDFLKGNYNHYPKLRNVCFNVINIANYIYNNYDSLKLGSDLRELSLEHDFGYIENIINTGKALEKLAEVIQNQNGDVSIIEDPYHYFDPKIEYSVYSNLDGYIHFDTYLIGLAAGELGLSRKSLGDIVDNNAGVIIEKSSGEFVRSGELVMKLFAKDKQSLDNALKILGNALKFSPEPVKYGDIYTVLIF
ncbi:MAG: thymidine phosphorylase, partial [Candidatus Calescibacterium sp.]|nr:thymidine phosphorylase [Candidatus Calescibacterium sp.]